MATCTWWRPSRPSDAAGVEVSAARRRHRHDDPARDHRRGSTPTWSACRCRPTSTGPRSATTSPAAAASGRTWSGARTASSWLSCPRRATTSRKPAGGRRRHRRGARRDEENAPDPLRIGPGHASTGATCPRRTKSSGSPSATIGATLSLRPRHRQAQEPDHYGRLATCTQLLRVDEKKRTLYFLGRREGAGRIRTSPTCIASASTART